MSGKHGGCTARHTILRLEELIKKHQQHLEDLAHAQAALRARAAAAGLALQQVAALLQLGALVNATTADANAGAWRGQLMQLGRELDLEAAGDLECGVDVLGWSPAAAAARAHETVAAGRLTAEGMSRGNRDFAMLAGCLLP
jgi:hypothetical protein